MYFLSSPDQPDAVKKREEEKRGKGMVRKDGSGAVS